MAYTMAEFRRELSIEILCEMSEEEFQRYLRLAKPYEQTSHDELLKAVSAVDRLKGLSAAEIVRSLPKELIATLRRLIDERIGGPSGEQMD